MNSIKTIKKNKTSCCFLQRRLQFSQRENVSHVTLTGIAKVCLITGLTSTWTTSRGLVTDRVGCTLSACSSTVNAVKPVSTSCTHKAVIIILIIFTTSTTLRTSLSGTFLQTLPDLVTPLKGHSLFPRSCPATRSAPSERFGY